MLGLGIPGSLPVGLKNNASEFEPVFNTPRESRSFLVIFVDYVRLWSASLVR